MPSLTDENQETIPHLTFYRQYLIDKRSRGCMKSTCFCVMRPGEYKRKVEITSLSHTKCTITENGSQAFEMYAALWMRGSDQINTTTPSTHHMFLAWIRAGGFRVVYGGTLISDILWKQQTTPAAFIENYFNTNGQKDMRGQGRCERRAV